MDDNEYTVETADLAEELIDQAIADIRLLEIDDDVIAGTLAVKSVLLRLRQGVSATEIVEEIQDMLGALAKHIDEESG